GLLLPETPFREHVASILRRFWGKGHQPLSFFSGNRAPGSADLTGGGNTRTIEAYAARRQDGCERAIPGDALAGAVAGRRPRPYRARRRREGRARLRRAPLPPAGCAQNASSKRAGS